MSQRYNTYEEFDGDFLKIAELIQQRRFQLLIHSCIYYELNNNLITDKQWDIWARELRDLQNQYPEISSRVVLYEDFKDWDASTGAFLKSIKEPWVMQRAKYLLANNLTSIGASIGAEYIVPKKAEKPKKKRRLF